MLARSFRLVSARLPRPVGRSSALLLAALILAGCGGSGGGKPMQHLAGPGFRFDAPGGWQVTRGQGRVTAGSGNDLVQVVTFRLLRPYSQNLFSKVAKELEVRMTTVAGQTGGTLAGSQVVTAGGIRAHSYQVRAGSRIDQYTFVLQGRREYQLLCRRDAKKGDAACRQLLQTFAIV
jgi:hypothetical protein